MVRANPTVRGEGREKRGRGGKKWGGEELEVETFETLYFFDGTFINTCFFTRWSKLQRKEKLLFN